MGKAAERVFDYCLLVLGGKAIVPDKTKTHKLRTLYDKYDCKEFFFVGCLRQKTGENDLKYACKIAK